MFKGIKVACLIVNWLFFERRQHGWRGNMAACLSCEPAEITTIWSKEQVGRTPVSYCRCLVQHHTSSDFLASASRWRRRSSSSLSLCSCIRRLCGCFRVFFFPFIIKAQQRNVRNRERTATKREADGAEFRQRQQSNATGREQPKNERRTGRGFGRDNRAIWNELVFLSAYY